jgi:hypothetical protein
MDRIPVGYTPIDSYYELQGFRFAQGVYERFFPFFAVFLIGCALVYLLMKKDRCLSDLVIYIFYLAFAFFLVGPETTKVALPEYAQSPEDFQRHFEDLGQNASTIKAPRAMLHMHYLIDALVQGAIGESKSKIGNANAPQRLNYLLKASRIYDVGLADAYRAFLVGCYVPAYGRAVAKLSVGPSKGNWLGFTKIGEGQDRPSLNPFTYTDDFYKDIPAVNADGDPVLKDGAQIYCTQQIRPLYDAVFEHISPRQNAIGPALDRLQEVLPVSLFGVRTFGSTHPETLKQMVELQNQYAMKGMKNWKIGDDHVKFLLNVTVTNETRAFFQVAGGEIKNLENAVPDYNIFSSSQQALSGTHPTVSGTQFWRWVKSTVSFVIRARQSIDQWFSHHAEVPAMYYKVTNYAPYVQGIAMMILIAIFPFAAPLVALPWGWKVLVKWGKILLMVKLWVVIWSMLADFNQARCEWYDDYAETGLSEDSTYIFGGICVLYVLTPAIAGIVVQLLDHATTAVAGAALSFMPQGAGASPYFQNATGQIFSGGPKEVVQNFGHYVTGGVFKSDHSGGGDDKVDLSQVASLEGSGGGAAVPPVV